MSKAELLFRIEGLEADLRSVRAEVLIMRQKLEDLKAPHDYDYYTAKEHGILVKLPKAKKCKCECRCK